MREVLEGTDSTVDATVGAAALLIAASGFAAEADRLAGHWQAVTGRPATVLAAGQVTARAWAMLFAARGSRPAWAGALPPLDLAVEEAAHRAYLDRRGGAVPTALLGERTAALIVSELVRQLDGTGSPDPVRAAAAQAEAAAVRGDAAAELARWAKLGSSGSSRSWGSPEPPVSPGSTSRLPEPPGSSGSPGPTSRLPEPPESPEPLGSSGSSSRLPDIAALAACRHVAPLLVAGADPLGLTAEGARRWAGDLIAALSTRYPPAPATGAARQWPALLRRILELRGCGAMPSSSPSSFRAPSLRVASAPAPGPAVEAAEKLLRTRLPQDYREFLLACDGLAGDDLFPRLLGVAELVPAQDGVVVISAGGPSVLTLVPCGRDWVAVEWDPELGSTAYPNFRRLLEHHLHLLEQAASP